jgi:hypothetical protein
VYYDQIVAQVWNDFPFFGFGDFLHLSQAFFKIA